MILSSNRAESGASAGLDSNHREELPGNQEGGDDSKDAGLGNMLGEYLQY